MGTAGYMAPEQAVGNPVDRRADIWSFGVVLWELLTGKRLFSGDTTAHILADVIRAPLDFHQLPESTPAPIRGLLERCLDRDVKTRLQWIGEARVTIQKYLKDPGAFELKLTRATAPGDGRPTGAARIWIGAAAMLAILTAALGYVAYRHAIEDPPRVQRFSLLTPEITNLNNAADIPEISPDGRRVVFAALVDGQSTLWVRDLDALTPRMLPDISGAIYPFWSPDSRWVGFFAENKLKKIDVTGGPAITLCNIPGIARGGTWNQNDVIVYSIQTAGLFRVSAAGGTPVALTEPNRAVGEITHRNPWFLPDGRHFFYTARGPDAASTRVYVDSIDTKPGAKTRKEVLAADTNAVYADGYLLFVRERTLMAQPFDASNLRATGDAVPVAEQVDYYPGNNQSQFSASRNGTLVYTSGATGGGKKQLTWLDRNGKPTGTVGMPADTLWARISPDGSTVATDPSDASGTRDIWLYDVARGTPSRFTFGPGQNEFPVWSPDGTRIAFASFRSGNQDPYLKAANGIGAEEALDKDPRNNLIDDWSHDGRYLIEEVIDLKTHNDIWIIPTFGDKKPFPYLNSEYREMNARLSPDGQWLAYVSDETKRVEVFVQTFPEHGGKWQISTRTGNYPVWSRDGRELYFIGDRKLMAVRVDADGKSFRHGAPIPLFDVAAAGQFDVSKDGRFLLQVPADQGSGNVPLTVVTNWQAALKK